MRKMKNKDYDNESLNYDNLGFDYLFKVDNKSELRNKKKEKNKNEKEEISLDNLINYITEEEKENNEENIVIDSPKKGQNTNDYLKRKIFEI